MAKLPEGSGSRNPMPGTPKRILIHDQLVTLLREGILGGRWRGSLPPELTLCREFQVSRMTLRKALAQLANEKWLELGGRGRSHRIVRRQRKRPSVRGRIVRVLTPFHPWMFSSSIREVLEALNERLMSEGLNLEVEHHPQLYERFQASKLARLDALPDTAGWALLYATPEIQKWFAKSARPTVVVGRVTEAVPLCAVYPDVEALARHAAGLLSGRGHRELVYLMATVTSASDRLTAEVFKAEALRLGARATVVTYEMGSQAVRRAILDLLASRPRPTAFLVGANETAVTVLCHLLAAGIRVPGEASVLSCVDDYLLGMTYPTTARYRINAEAMGRKAAEMIVTLIQHGTGRIRTTAVMPEFVEAESVGAGPA
ncbi:hypothetical protein HAHE_18170 [Haloferula helveola]|uniref:HTH gntR-type domain-containing protein n=1 Tax=Haloferula helveola TaxID=490095 RepID=A0ABM7RJX6_9BACT|nr:hypothetical protein HAHE_18170 [Haloferula helveola]